RCSMKLFACVAVLATLAPLSTLVAASGQCEAYFVDYHSWTNHHDGLDGFNGRLDFPIESDISKWEVTIEFSSDVEAFEVWTADSSATNGSSFTLSNKDYNGVQPAGNTLPIEFLIRYDSESPVPYITSLKFNDQDCGVPGTYAPTTTTTTTTTSTTTTTPLPTTTTTTEPTTTTTPEPTTTTTPATTTALEGCQIQKWNEWGSGYQGRIRIPLSEDLTQWEVELELDALVDDMQVFNAQTSAKSGSSFTLNNHSWNALQTQGNVLNIDFLYL
ncbi:unnamed protein product, partial [Meganyctiphanes norvegica]